jgi:hypothetical protein
VGSRILAYRPAVVVERLSPLNDACPLSLRDLLQAAGEAHSVLPIVRAPVIGVARAALVAASEARSALGLSLPPGTPPEPWFQGVTAAANELAGGLPIFLSAGVTVEGGDEADLERGARESFRLVDAGITHLSIDVRAVPAAQRAEAFAAVAAPAVEQGCCVDCLVALEDSPRALVSRLTTLGAPPEALSVSCPAVSDAAQARAQVVRLVRLSAELAGVPVLRRGPVSAALLDELSRSPIRGCEDGGAAAISGIAVIPWDQIAAPSELDERSPALTRAAEELSHDAADRLEARAYVEVAGFIERLGAAGSGRRIVELLERRLDER